MTRYEQLNQKLLNREKIVGATMAQLDDTLLLPVMNRPDVDFVLFDAEHGIYNSESLIPMLQISRLLEFPTIVRVPDAEYHLISRYIYMGADNIMLPRVESMEQMEAAVKAIRFYPVGKMGNGGHGQFRGAETFEEYQDRGRLLYPQIESLQGLELLPEIIETYRDYIGAVIIGPYDLSTSVRTPRNIRSDVMLETVQKVFDVCNEHKISCGIFCDDEERAAKYRSMGCNVLWQNVDINLFKRGYDDLMDQIAKIK